MPKISMKKGEEIGKRVAELRREKGITQQELAAFIGRDRAQISVMESCGRNLSSPEILSELARVFAVSLDWLIDGKEASDQTPARVFDLEGLSGDQAQALMLLRQQTEYIRSIAELVRRDPAKAAEYMDLFFQHQSAMMQAVRKQG